MGIRSFLRQVRARQRYIKDYIPLKLTEPAHKLEVTSAWKGLDLIIEDILDRHHIGRYRCIEFGVEFGYSAVVFSSFFNEVVGVDTFSGDCHTNHKGDHYEATQKKLAAYPNIRLVRSDYRDFIKDNDSRFDFAHVDIVHTYNETYECGLWAVLHSDVVIFHDTESFPDVRRAVIDIAKAANRVLYNYPFHNGLGIIIDRRMIRNIR